ncbi:heavy metal translocating P-type ATPase [Estrella lausannensis]|uniref:Heavy metal translocating ATPase, P-type n=1 Tax=Estrella lausannensis TaxID=483423 RepID=A0A0H5E6Y2_9BACT|nr:cation-translocating P-type ATPase [Estrella lausannensis]CRX39055.1 heavy metal translocating ATPase, P-type [Estrella lausannensis]
MTSTFTQEQSSQRHLRQPVIFEEFFELGLEESKSPFLTPESRNWGVNLPLKASLLALFMLCISFFLSYFEEWIPLSQLALVIVYFLVGIPALIESIEDIAKADINIDVLMTLAAFSSFYVGSGMEGGMLLVLFALSSSIEEAVQSKAKSTLSALGKLVPTKALVILSDGTHQERSVKDISVGASILIQSGQVVPLDGRVVKGFSSANLSHITGESIPVPIKPGDEIPAGAQNDEGSLVVEVTKTEMDSTVSRIIKLVTEAQEAKPVLQRFFDKVSNSYAMGIIALSFLLAFALPLVYDIAYLGEEGSLYRAVTFLIAASPCALILAIPIAYLSAISSCARKGILLKGGLTLDALAHCRAVAFDKTGTLTTGKLVFKGINALHEEDKILEPDALRIAYSLEKNTIHPIAKSLVEYAKSVGMHGTEIHDFRAVPGFGLEGLATLEKEEKIHIGNLDFIKQLLPPDEGELLENQFLKILEEGNMVAALLVGNKPFLLSFQDQIRTGVKETIRSLREIYRLKLVMITGDHLQSAKRVAKEIGLDDFFANLKPQDKLNIVSDLSKRFSLAMVGDGINDAPSLARADVGIGLGQIGSNAATQASDVILLNDNIEMIDWLVGKSRATRAIVRQNLVLAAGALLIASLLALLGVLPLWLAVIIHEGGTVLVGLNGLRLLR